MLWSETGRPRAVMLGESMMVPRTVLEIGRLKAIVEARRGLGSPENSSGFGVLRFQTVHHFLEHSSAVMVALELVEAGAGWGEQDDIAGLSDGGCAPDRVVQCFGVDDFCGTLDV